LTFKKLEIVLKRSHNNLRQEMQLKILFIVSWVRQKSHFLIRII